MYVIYDIFLIDGVALKNNYYNNAHDEKDDAETPAVYGLCVRASSGCLENLWRQICGCTAECLHNGTSVNEF